MAEICKNPYQLQPVASPDVEILLFGSGKVNFAWNFIRKVPFWFLYHNPEPGALLEFENISIRPESGQIILIPPYTPFRSRCEQPFEHLYIHFAAGRPYSQVKPKVISLSSADVSGVLTRVWENATPAAVYGLLFSVLAAIPEECFAEPETPVDDRIQRALSLMTRDAGNTGLAAAVGMSVSNFQRVFKRDTGISPQQYALHLRLEKARCALASKQEIDISKIAAECGFADRYAFSKAFKKYTGVSPARYRDAETM